MHKSIQEFLSTRKIGWIKKKIEKKKNITSHEVEAIEQQACELFLLSNWLPDAAKRAVQLSQASHPSKFSHPGLKLQDVSAVIADAKNSADGFLRWGNAPAEPDFFGNAGVLDVYKFLSLELDDGLSILAHLEQNTDKIRKTLTVATASFQEIRKGLLSIKKTNQQTTTHSKLKQVYFPVPDGYHLLSILTPSGLTFSLKEKIQSMRFSETVKQARDDKRKNIYNQTGFDELYGLVMIGYGGTKPQNISVLNSQQGGKAYLLPSTPPALSKDYQRLPKSDFFKNILSFKNFKHDFFVLHGLFSIKPNNKDIREYIGETIQSITDCVIFEMTAVRQAQMGWSNGKEYSKLPIHQKIWLDSYYEEKRLSDGEWAEKIILECAMWIFDTYKYSLKNSFKLFQDDLDRIKNHVKAKKDYLL